MWNRLNRIHRRKSICSIILAAAIAVGSVMPVYAADNSANDSGDVPAYDTEIQDSRDIIEDEDIGREDTEMQQELIDVDGDIPSDEDGTEILPESNPELDGEEPAQIIEEPDLKDEGTGHGEDAVNLLDSEEENNNTQQDSQSESDAVEEGTVLPSVTRYVLESDGRDDSEEMFAGYVDRLFSTDDSTQYAGGRRKAKKDIGSKFTGASQTVYTELRAGAQEIAAGQRDSSVFTFQVEELGFGSSVSWSAQELGVAEVVTGGAIADDASAAAMEKFEREIQIDDIIHALLADCPYELYWHDKTTGVGRSVGIGAVYSGGEWRCYVSGGYEISYAVAQEFAVSEYTADTVKTGAATAALGNAENILEEYEDLSDIEKLYAYKDEICREVSYNYAAANGGIPYGNPWQLIWVFDGDETTNVVCEGYSKAFQYLCDRTDFTDSSICAYTVTGEMSGGTGAGPHMWSIVTLDGKYNYLADVTNSDSGTVGQNGTLFLAPYTSGSVEDGYVFNCGNGTSINYIYDDDTISIFSESDLTIASVPYGEIPLDEPLSILVQPESVTSELHERVELHVEANLEDVTYQWQWSTDGVSWKNCTSVGFNTDTFSFLMQPALSGRLYRCVISHGQDTEYSDNAAITLVAGLEITLQPQDVNAAVGETVSLHVETNKDAEAYQWQWSANGTTWKNCTSAGYNTDTFSFRMQAALDGRYYRCVVKSGNSSVASDAAIITMVAGLEITLQPQDVNAAVGETVSLHVETNKDTAAYQWQWSANGTTWKNCTSAGYNTDTFSFRMQAALDGRYYRCVVTSGGISIASDSAQIILVAGLEITLQPQDVNAAVGETVSLHVETNKDTAAYQWQWSANGTTWKNCTSAGYNTDTFSFRMQAALDGRYYRCAVTSGGISIVSDSAQIMLVAGLEITLQPQDVNAVVGETVSLHIETNRDEAAYQWQWSANGTTWKNCTSSGYNTDTFSFRMQAVLDGRYYRCRVSDGRTNIYSDAVLINLAKNSGSFGDNGTWNLDDQGVLTIENCRIIDENAFYNNKYIKKVILNEGVEEIRTNAFANSSVRIINLPDSVTSIADDAFFNCDNVLFFASFGSDPYYWAAQNDERVCTSTYNYADVYEKDGLVYRIENSAASVIGYAGTPQDVDIPSLFKGFPVTSVTGFRNCISLKSVSFSEGIRSVEGFYGCSNLETVNFSESITNIDDYAFGNCNLKSILLPSGITSIAEGAFSGNKITELQIPDTITEIGRSAFSSNHNLSVVTIPSSVTVIRNGAFDYCNHIMDCNYNGRQEEWNSIQIEENNDFLIKAHIVFLDGEQPYSRFTWNLESGIFTLIGEGDSEHYFWIGENGISAAWDDRRDEITEVILSEGITGIHGPAFAFCPNLKKITLPSTLKTLGNTVFDTCLSLESVTIPDGVESIGGFVFWNCYDLKSVVIPVSVTSLGRNAFSGCPLTDVYYSGSQAEWELIEGSADAGISANATIHFGKENDIYENFGYIIKDGECTITSYNGEDTTISIPASINGYPVTSVNIGKKLPDGTNNAALMNIETVNLPNSVERLGEEAFRDWYSLKTVNGLDSITYVGAYCFSGSGVTELLFSEKLSYAGLYAFDANDLINIRIPDTLTWDGLSESGFDGRTVFYNHESLENIDLIVTGNSPTLAMDGPALYTAGMTYLICYPCKNPLSYYRIPDGVGGVYEMAFDIREPYKGEGLYEVYLPTSLGGLSLFGFYTDMYVENENGEIENVILPRFVVEENSIQHRFCIDSSQEYTLYWRLRDD